jgi:very-short-patch-repair endonuclease
MTDAEQRLWQKLKRRQIATVKFRRQQGEEVFSNTGGMLK